MLKRTTGCWSRLTAKECSISSFFGARSSIIEKTSIIGRLAGSRVKCDHYLQTRRWNGSQKTSRSTDLLWDTASTAKALKRDAVTKHTVTKQKIIPTNSLIIRPPYAETGNIPYSFFPSNDVIQLEDENTIKRLEISGLVAASILQIACATAQSSPGMTTDEIDQIVHNAILEIGAYPSPLNYRGFPKSLCSSVNEVVCHGIPDTRPLQYGDVVSFDVSVFINGVHGDNCATLVVGDDNKHNSDESVEHPLHEERRLVRATQEALQAAIAVCKPGGCLSHVGHAISDVADSYGYESVRDYRGHGINETFHCPPYVKHYRNNDFLELVPGMVFTIEPMLVQKGAEVYEWDDGWTVATRDGGLAAQFEHMVWITEDGVKVLTENPVFNPSGLSI